MSFERSGSERREQTHPRIRLEFFRHDEKGKAADASTEADRRVTLTEKGRKQAAEVGKLRNPRPEVGIAFGSTRDRAQETAILSLVPVMSV